MACAAREASPAVFRSMTPCATSQRAAQNTKPELNKRQVDVPNSATCLFAPGSRMLPDLKIHNLVQDSDQLSKFKSCSEPFAL